MTSAARKLFEQALALPVDEREALAAALNATLDRSEPLSAEWAAEIARRIDAVERGESQLIEGDEVDARLRAALRRAR